ncbi:fluoride efflux transporter FluC [Nigerium massiliense]|uniref:fluoride efflux transporter FluC n=1 Tax=Nigerium massiliense TaxID=1522317 RepID=UPI00058C5AD3|nr:CrcB family protein [Nigerium massiliense]
MTWPLFCLIALAGGLGAVCRLVLDGVVRSVSSDLPWGTAVINLAGSFLLGLVTGLVGSHVLPDAWQHVAGTGFLGGFTTFSTACVDAVRLLADRRRRAAVGYALGVLAGGAAVAGIGLGLGTAAA